ncbi:hypothetical protein [Shewanella sp. Isolate11]|uniref:hypothetical protein n=1 Tax=Shewanella sp. Isolate11 TaxID=2908530 RepID=UPI001EFDEA3B|nr:hypothetical protein [Shewanella sp. Isolate11]MCG9697186.1 hypothetical protein [Shewanella sp. Isolate11]
MDEDREIRIGIKKKDGSILDFASDEAEKSFIRQRILDLDKRKKNSLPMTKERSEAHRKLNFVLLTWLSAVENQRSTSDDVIAIDKELCLEVAQVVREICDGKDPFESLKKRKKGEKAKTTIVEHGFIWAMKYHNKTDEEIIEAITNKGKLTKGRYIRPTRGGIPHAVKSFEKIYFEGLEEPYYDDGQLDFINAISSYRNSPKHKALVAEVLIQMWQDEANKNA